VANCTGTEAMSWPRATAWATEMNCGSASTTRRLRPTVASAASMAPVVLPSIERSACGSAQNRSSGTGAPRFTLAARSAR